MVAEWFSCFFKKPQGFYPADNNKYYIDQLVLRFTEVVLQDYGNKSPACEGLIYWAGHIDGNKFYVTHAIAPKVAASRYGFLTTHESNAMVVEYLCDNNLIYIAQVHSHPGEWVEHSDIDNEETAFRSEGFISLVVPLFSKKGILPWKQCGVHLYTHDEFKMLSSKYVKKRFSVSNLNKQSITFKDYRNEAGLV